MATNVMSGLIFQALKSGSANIHTGAAMIVPKRLYKNTTISFDGSSFITWVCSKKFKVTQLKL